MKVAKSLLICGIALIGCFEVAAAPVGLDVFVAESTTAASFTGATNTGFTLGNGVDNFDATSRGVAAFTDGDITLGVGEILSFTFDLSVASGFDGSYERGFRFGLYNKDTATIGSVVGQFDAGPTPGGTTTRITNNSTNTNLNTTGATAGQEGNAGTAITNGNNLEVSITVERVSATLYDITTNWDGTAFTVEDYALNVNGGVFDSVAVFTNAGGLDPLVDGDTQLIISNAAVELIVPEPGSLTLVGLGVVMFMRKRD